MLLGDRKMDDVVVSLREDQKAGCGKELNIDEAGVDSL
jgi:hypothetical protein